MKKILGRLKFQQNRLSSYLTIIVGLQVSFLFVITDPLGISRYYWLVFLIILVIMILIVDRDVSEVEIDTWLNRSKSFRELCEDVKEIKNGKG